MKNFFEINRALAAKKNFFYLALAAKKKFFVLLISAVALVMTGCGDGGNAPDYSSNIQIKKLVPNQIYFTYTPVDQEMTFNTKCFRVDELTITNGNIQQAVQDWFDKQTSSVSYMAHTATEVIKYYGDLNPDTDYYVIIFTKDAGQVTVHAYKLVHTPAMGKFTINATGKQVHIAGANLVYYDEILYFAEEPWSMIGEDNQKIGQADCEIDLFGWATGKNPLNHSITASDYPSSFTSNEDWGQYTIYGYAKDYQTGWYTMGGLNWKYIFNTRTNADQLYGQATIDDVYGYVLLPDDWKSEKSPIAFQPGVTNFTENNWTSEDWWQFEALGAVFLPLAGYRYNNSYFDRPGYYWTGSLLGGQPVALFLDMYGVNPTYKSESYYGYSVRLVRDVE